MKAVKTVKAVEDEDDKRIASKITQLRGRNLHFLISISYFIGNGRQKIK
jgi:hypothetical protein